MQPFFDGMAALVSVLCSTPLGEMLSRASVYLSFISFLPAFPIPYRFLRSFSCGPYAAHSIFQSFAAYSLSQTARNDFPSPRNTVWEESEKRNEKQYSIDDSFRSHCLLHRPIVGAVRAESERGRKRHRTACPDCGSCLQRLDDSDDSCGEDSPGAVFVRASKKSSKR